MGAAVEMNSTTLPETATDRQVAEAFRATQDQARYEHGHGGYTGTIAEADGVEIRRDQRFDDARTAYEWGGDHADKWGPALAVLVRDKASNTYHFAFVGCYSC